MRRVLIVTGLVAVAASVAIATAQSRPFATKARHAPARAVAAQADGPSIESAVMAARVATVKYANDLDAAKAAGYRIITRMIPNMGYHFMNPSVTGFDVTKPAILVYEHVGSRWQLGALEWVFTSMPSRPPLPGAQYGVFGAACHYIDGTLVFAESQSQCAPTSPETGAQFSFWHPRLITLHFWVWYPNPSGIFSGINPLVSVFNGG